MSTEILMLARRATPGGRVDLGATRPGTSSECRDGRDVSVFHTFVYKRLGNANKKCLQQPSATA